MTNQPKPNPNKLFSKVSTFSHVALLAAVMGSTVQTQSAHAAIIGTFEIESPTIQYNQFGQNNDGNGDIKVYNQTFNAGDASTTTVGNQVYSRNAPRVGSVTANYQWNLADGTTIGTYNNIYARTADDYGGSIDPTSSGKRSNYVTVNPKVGALTTSTLTLNQGQKYFGLWWSAGDKNNKLEFQDASGKVVGSFLSSDVTAAIQRLDTTTENSYKGNPTQTSKKNTKEYYAYLNFFATDNTAFRKVVFTNATSTGFESDNHAVATSYNKIRGQNVAEGVPEPLTILGAATAVAFGASFKRRLANAKK